MQFCPRSTSPVMPQVLKLRRAWIGSSLDMELSEPVVIFDPRWSARHISLTQDIGEAYAAVPAAQYPN